MKGDWACVYVSTYPHLVELAKILLEHEGIESVIKNNQDISYVSIGEIELYVLREDLIKAKFILEQKGS